MDYGLYESREKAEEALRRLIKENQWSILHRFHSPTGPRRVSRHKEFDEMMRAVDESLSPLPAVDDETSARMLFSAGLMGREKMLELLDTLFTREQQFAMLDRFVRVPPADDEREMTEEAVALLLNP